MTKTELIRDEVVARGWEATHSIFLSGLFFSPSHPESPRTEPCQYHWIQPVRTNYHQFQLRSGFPSAASVTFVIFVVVLVHPGRDSSRFLPAQVEITPHSSSHTSLSPRPISTCVDLSRP